MPALPGRSDSCWVASAPRTRYAPLTRSGRADVVVVGAGIVGLTAAWHLASVGMEVAVIDATRIGRAVTGRSTAKVTWQHTLAYGAIARRGGMARARLYAQANRAGVVELVQLAKNLRIECDLERRSAYEYTLREERRPALEREVGIARGLGLDADFVERAPLPFANAGAVVFPDQWQFNPAKYLVGLAAAVREAGGRLYENTRVDEVEHTRRGWRVSAGRHHLLAPRVVSATHMPIGSPIDFDELTQPRCHIAMAFRAPARTLDGMFIDIDRPMHSLRMGRDERGPMLVALGPKFLTGQDRDVAKRFRNLEAWIRTNLPAAGEVAWRWVNEDYDSPDRIPFAGELSKKAPGLYVATGFNGWGISNGTAAGMLIADQIRQRPNPWAELYDPERKARKINKGGETKSAVKDVDAIAPGEGGVVEHGKQPIAIWKSPAGQVHAFSARCTHMGCTVTWNNAERTWDCPCHGSMFTCDGEVIHGPATEALKRVKLGRG